MKRINLILAVLAAVLAVPTWLTLSGDRTVFVSLDEVPALFPGFTPGNVAIVDIAVPQRAEDGEPVQDENGNLQFETLRLQRVDQDDEAAWVLGGDSPMAGVGVRYEQVRDLVLEPLGEIRRSTEALVQEDAPPADLERFGLADLQATRIRCYGASQTPPVVVAELLLGADASGGQVGKDAVRGYFVRASDSNDVVLHERVYWRLSVDPNDWIERKPFGFGADDAVEVALANAETRAQDRYPDGQVVIGRSDVQAAEWQRQVGGDDRGAVRNTEVHAFVRSLAGLSIERFVQPLPESGPDLDGLLAQHGLAQPRAWTEIGLGDGTRHRIEVGSPVPGQPAYFVRISSVPFLVTVGDWVVSLLQRDPTLWFEPK